MTGGRKSNESDIKLTLKRLCRGKAGEDERKRRREQGEQEVDEAGVRSTHTKQVSSR